MVSRVHVGIVAFAADPHRGSEPGAGYAAISAAAQDFRVTAFVSSEVNVADLRKALGTEAGNVNLISVRPTRTVTGTLLAVVGGRSGEHIAWQLALRGLVRECHARDPFSLLHHATYATDWAPSAIAFGPEAREIALVWGPVGGYSKSALPFHRWLGAKAILGRTTREVVTGLLRPRTQRRLANYGATPIAQNHDVALYMAKRWAHVVVRPNVVVPRLEGAQSGARRKRVVGFCGHVRPEKGLRLLIDALAQVELQDWRLEIVGVGAVDELLDYAKRRGVEDRLLLLGSVPRSEVLHWMRTISVFAFLSFNESAGWALGEAATLETPVVVLDRGGPPTVVAGAGVVPALPIDTLHRRIAEAVAGGGEMPAVDWSQAAYSSWLKAAYSTALEASARPPA